MTAGGGGQIALQEYLAQCAIGIDAARNSAVTPEPSARNCPARDPASPPYCGASVRSSTSRLEACGPSMNPIQPPSNAVSSVTTAAAR